MRTGSTRASALGTDWRAAAHLPPSRPVVERPDSVTHFTCPEGFLLTTNPRTTHHMLASARCRYCHKPAAQLRREAGL